MKIRKVLIKGKIRKLIKEDGEWVYLKHFCKHCGKRIPFKESQKRDGYIPDFIWGHNCSMKGKHHTSKSIEKIHKSKTGIPCPNEQKEKISETMYGRTLSEEHCENISIGKTGIPLSEKHKDNISKGLFKSYLENPELRENNRKSHIGLPPNKGAGTGKGRYYNTPLQGRKWLRSSYEIKYAKYLDKKGILWKYEWKAFLLSSGTTYRPDFYLVKKKKYREIKGYMRQESRRKVKLFKQEYPNKNFKILYAEDLIQKGIKL